MASRGVLAKAGPTPDGLRPLLPLAKENWVPIRDS